MVITNTGMKGPSRPAPAVPPFTVNRYSPVTNWNDDPFGADVFEPNPQYLQKKKPPPRPPPPRVNKQPDVPSKPSHFIRKPTVLTSLLSRKNKNSVPNNSVTNNVPSLLSDFNSEVDSNRMFPKCEPKNVNTGALIDLSSPPSSPTFTTRSSSDGLSVDSFGSDATSSTNHPHAMNGGSTSQAESGFEDDFDLFLHSRKAPSKEDTFDDFTTVDPFSPVSNRPPISKKPVLNNLYDFASNGKPSSAVQLKGPTIIRAKPARPKPPDNSAILKSTFAGSRQMTLMNVNTTTPIQKVTSNFGESFDDAKPFTWDRPHEPSPERDYSPPMPSVPPPPPPALDDDLPALDDGDLPWPEDLDTPLTSSTLAQDEEPYAVALFDYATGHPDDLSFKANQRISLIRRENAEWLYGSAGGARGLFPSNYVEIKVPLPDDPLPAAPRLGTALALYDLESTQPGDLAFSAGDSITVTHKINDEWYFGECGGVKGQFPVNYVQLNVQ
ncbi:unnamed protein product [Plutella xylostella]|uniref:(diamondback moth) hypothetical protein n=1 Tax=Plutella xylostella TaxID=51655 RepID=A0A8S4EBL8_PLUXY|nr:unnamed protein product [Plutella xylostella]